MGNTASNSAAPAQATTAAPPSAAPASSAASASGSSSGSGGSGGGGRQRYPSVSEEPLVVPYGRGRHSTADDQYQFSQSLVKSAAINIVNSSSSPEDVFYARYRAGSVNEPPRFQAQDSQLPTVIKWDKGGKEVYVSGSFNGWRKIPLVKSTNNFSTIVNLPEGEHEYKFFVDGHWVHNPDEPIKSNSTGTVHNLVTVKKTDFEVFRALEKDIEAVQSKTSETGGSSPAGSYTQEVPPHKPIDRHTGPPMLPPHLLQVILNQDLPEHLEPSILPEPNHVMLNHLYALSIKDGVMVLSSTGRYKRKYVTTLLYKPVDL